MHKQIATSNSTLDSCASPAEYFIVSLSPLDSASTIAVGNGSKAEEKHRTQFTAPQTPRSDYSIHQRARLHKKLFLFMPICVSIGFCLRLSPRIHSTRRIFMRKGSRKVLEPLLAPSSFASLKTGISAKVAQQFIGKTCFKAGKIAFTPARHRSAVKHSERNFPRRIFYCRGAKNFFSNFRADICVTQRSSPSLIAREKLFNDCLSAQFDSERRIDCEQLSSRCEDSSDQSRPGQSLNRICSGNYQRVQRGHDSD